MQQKCNPGRCATPDWTMSTLSAKKPDMAKTSTQHRKLSNNIQQSTIRQCRGRMHCCFNVKSAGYQLGGIWVQKEAVKSFIDFLASSTSCLA